MKNENILDYQLLSCEMIKDYINKHTKQEEITCLIPKEDQNSAALLEQHGFRYAGKRLMDGNVLIVYRWFQGVEEQYEDMAAFFDRRADDYDFHMREGNHTYENGLAKITSFINTTQEKIKILDLGCGTGAELSYIFKRAPEARITCVDMSMGMLEKLKEDYREYSDNLEIICGSYVGLDFDTEYYDYVIACNTLHHLLKEDKLELYLKIKKSLKKAGAFLIEDYVVTEEEEEEMLKAYLSLIESGEINSGKLYHIDIPLSENSERELLEKSDFRNLVLERVGENGIYIKADK